MGEKSTLVVYRSNKNEIKAESVLYDNTYASMLLLRAKANCLPLNQRNRFAGEEEVCMVYDQGVAETQEHFLMGCGELRSLRERHGVEDGVRVSDLLLFKEKTEEEITRKKKYLPDKPGKLTQCIPIHGSILGQCTTNRANAEPIFLVCWVSNIQKEREKTENVIALRKFLQMPLQRLW